MVWDTCNITFTNGSNGVFYTNDMVTGSVILNVTEKIKINQIDIHVKGVSRATWMRPSATAPYVRVYSEKREVFNVLIDVFRDLKDVTVKPGVISRQFHFFLPSDLPSTYEDSVAKVYYKIIIKSKGGWAYSKKKKSVFKVINYVDLTQFDDYKIPMLYDMAKTFGKCSHFVMHFKTYKGFAANQTIKFEAIITNEKKIKVTKLKVALIQKLDYNVSSGYSSNEKALCESYFTDVLNLSEQSCCFQMEIPQVVPTTANVQDPMVNISYFLRVKVAFRFHLPLFADIPVTIGTVPLNHKSFQ